MECIVLSHRWWSTLVIDTQMICMRDEQDRQGQKSLKEMWWYASEESHLSCFQSTVRYVQCSQTHRERASVSVRERKREREKKETVTIDPTRVYIMSSNDQSSNGIYHINLYTTIWLLTFIFSISLSSLCRFFLMMSMMEVTHIDIYLSTWTW